MLAILWAVDDLAYARRVISVLSRMAVLIDAHDPEALASVRRCFLTRELTG